MRHGDIKSNLSIDIKALRDLNNKLEMMSEKDHEEYIFTINEDTLG